MRTAFQLSLNVIPFHFYTSRRLNVGFVQCDSHSQKLCSLSYWSGATQPGEYNWGGNTVSPFSAAEETYLQGEIECAHINQQAKRLWRSTGLHGVTSDRAKKLIDYLWKLKLRGVNICVGFVTGNSTNKIQITWNSRGVPTRDSPICFYTVSEGHKHSHVTNITTLTIKR
jgi:hypothetical protein